MTTNDHSHGYVWLFLSLSLYLPVSPCLSRALSLPFSRACARRSLSENKGTSEDGLTALHEAARAGQVPSVLIH